MCKDRADTAIPPGTRYDCASYGPKRDKVATSTLDESIPEPIRAIGVA